MSCPAAGHGVLADDRSPQRGDEVGQAVVHLRVSMVGTASQNHQNSLVAQGFGIDVFRLGAQLSQVVRLLVPCRPHCGAYLAPWQVEFAAEVAHQRCRVREVYKGRVHDGPGILEFRQILAHHLRVAAGHRAGEGIAHFGKFLRLTRNAGEENALDAAFKQGQHMAVRQLRRVAHRV